jgi:hypothetical protein
MRERASTAIPFEAARDTGILSVVYPDRHVSPSALDNFHPPPRVRCTPVSNPLAARPES